MKTKVRVEVTSISEVDIVVEHEEGDDPTDLSEQEKNEAIGLIRLTSNTACVTSVQEVGPLNE